MFEEEKSVWMGLARWLKKCDVNLIPKTPAGEHTLLLPKFQGRGQKSLEKEDVL